MNETTAEIVEFGGDTVVRASAGSGKTSLLVKKFLYTLREAGEEGLYSSLDNILAITFTDKAAAEMRSRISQGLLQDVKSLEKEKEGGEQAHLFRHLRAARRKMTQAYISTIHSFCARVLKENPIEAGLDPGFKIMDGAASAEMMERALERFLLMKLRKGDGALIELAYRYGFSSDYAYESSIKKIIATILPLLRAASAKPRELLREYDLLLKEIKERLSRFKTQAETAAGLLEPFANTEKRKEKLQELKAGVARLAPKNDAKSGAAFKLAAQLEKLSRGFGFKSDTDAKQAAERLKSALGDYSKTLVSSLAYESCVQLRDLLEEFYGYYENRVKSRALLDFDDLQERTLYLFERCPEVLEHYRKKFRRVLVDEFQDVNELQKRLIYFLASPGEGRLFIVGDPKQAIYGFRGGNVEVFYEAQADIEKNGGQLFHLRKNYRSVPELVEFSNSWFSRYSKTIFTQDDMCDANRAATGSPAVESITFFSESLSADDARFKEATLIAARIKEMATSAEFMVRDGDVMRRVNYGDIVILFRKFTALSIYESALSSAGLPYMVHKGSGFYQSQEVADILSVLSYIENSSDIVSWVSALRSPLAGCSDEMILRLRRTAKGKLIDPLVYLNGKRPAIKGADQVDVEKFVEFTGWVRELISVKDKMTVSEIMETLLEKSRITGILGAQPDGLQKVANVLKLIETARSMEQGSEATLKNFLRRTTTLALTGMDEPQAQVAAGSDETVRLMTVHQCKGLEFPVVFLADINSIGVPKPAPVIFHPKRGLAVKYVDKTRLSAHKGALFEEINRLIEEKESEDEMRLFYVACTRARDRLVLSGQQSVKKSGRSECLSVLTEELPSLFVKSSAPKPAAIVPEVEKSPYELLKEEAHPKAAKPSAASMRSVSIKTGGERRLSMSVGRVAAFTSCPREYIFNYLYGIPATHKRKAGATDAAALGTAVHSVMENIDFETDKKTFKESLKSAVNEKLAQVKSMEKTAAVKRLTALYDVDPFKKLRDGSLTLSGREVEFSARFSGHSASCMLSGKIDLLLREGKEKAWVVDYKYSAASGAADSHKFQLEIYALAIAAYLGIDSVTCALVYLKSEKPRVYKWELDRLKLAKLEQRLLKITSDIYDWEDKGRSFYSGGLSAVSLPAVDCPNPRCGYKGFCRP